MLENILSKIKEMKERRIAELNLPQGETNDMQLKSLRRQRQNQTEEQEKIRLKSQIAHYKKNQMRKQLYGVVKNVKAKKLSKSKKINNILNNGNSLLKNF